MHFSYERYLENQYFDLGAPIQFELKKVIRLAMIIIVLSYLIGNFSSAYILGKVLKTDIRAYGGNAGLQMP